MKTNAANKFDKYFKAVMDRKVEGVVIEDGVLVYSFDDGSMTAVCVEDGQLTIYHGRELN